MRRPKTPSDTIRWFARWGPWVLWSVALVMFVAIFAMPGPPVYSWINPVFINVMCGFVVRYLRPRMLANADLWDEMEER